MTQTDRIALIEALLFVSDRPLPLKELQEFLPAAADDDDDGNVKASLEALREQYEASPRGLQVEHVAGGYRLATRAEHGDSIREFFSFKNRQRLSRAALETLAIVAYRQPATHPEIQEIRSVSSEGVLKTLQDRRLVRVVGRKDTVGKPLLYGTTKEFLEHFGLAGLDALPPMEEFEQLIAQMEPEELEGSVAPMLIEIAGDDGDGAIPPQAEDPPSVPEMMTGPKPVPGETEPA